jgi:flavin-dependent dehydrogenase
MLRGRTIRMIRRDEFDAWLAGKARERGIAIREEVTVRSVVPGKAGVTIETDAGSYQARAVVAADGSNGIVRRSVLPKAPIYTARTIEVLAPPNPADRHRPDEAYFDFRPVPNSIAGYTWDFPSQVKGQPVRVWGIYDANLFESAKRTPLKELLAAEMARHGYRLEDCEIHGHPIRWFDPLNKFSVPGVLLVGDAAGVDSIFGEGISIALGYGKIAARSLLAALRKNDFSFREYHARLLLSPLGQALVVRWLITYVLFSLQWRWIQFLIWVVLQPFVYLVSMLGVINWARRDWLSYFLMRLRNSGEFNSRSSK